MQTNESNTSKTKGIETTGFFSPWFRVIATTVESQIEAAPVQVGIAPQ